MKVYVTKYALTQGIFTLEGMVNTEVRPDGTMFCPDKSEGYQMSMFKPDWHETWEEALAHAEKMREKKIASLRKQMAKLEGMTFKRAGM